MSIRPLRAPALPRDLHGRADRGLGGAGAVAAGEADPGGRPGEREGALTITIFRGRVFSYVHLYIEVFLLMCTHIRECF